MTHSLLPATQPKIERFIVVIIFRLVEWVLLNQSYSCRYHRKSAVCVMINQLFQVHKARTEPHLIKTHDLDDPRLEVVDLFIANPHSRFLRAYAHVSPTNRRQFLEHSRKTLPSA